MPSPLSLPIMREAYPPYSALAVPAEPTGEWFGTCRKCCVVSIREETSKVNCSICFRMYAIKASLDQRPIIIIAKTGTPPRYMDICMPNIVAPGSMLVVRRRLALGWGVPHCERSQPRYLWYCGLLKQPRHLERHAQIVLLVVRLRMLH